jgi:hypothetical protein
MSACEYRTLVAAQTVSPLWWFHEHGVHVHPLPGGAYAVALGGPLVVLAAETAAARLWVADAIAAGVFPATPLVVTTPTGVHRYYRVGGAPPALPAGVVFLGAGACVRGPGSPGYTAAPWAWRWEDLPFLCDGGARG